MAHVATCTCFPDQKCSSKQTSSDNLVDRQEQSESEAESPESEVRWVLVGDDLGRFPGKYTPQVNDGWQWLNLNLPMAL